MISPHPDVKTLTLTKEDRFMVVACDGIWNSLTSQETCDFISKRLDQDMKLSVICEEVRIYSSDFIMFLNKTTTYYALQGVKTAI